MKISGIEITDTFGCRHFKVGKFSAIRIVGQNGSGKSSVLRSLAYVFDGGCDPSVIRKGADQSVVELLISDGTRIVKTTRPKKARKGGEITGYVADLEVTAPDGTPRPAPKSYIEELGKVWAIDPSSLLRIDCTTVPGRKALADQLQRLVPISFDPEEVNAAVSFRSSPDVAEPDTIALPVSPEAPMSLEDLKKAVASITEQRRREGDDVRKTDGAISRLNQSLPESKVATIDRYKTQQSAAEAEKAMRAALDEAENFRREVEQAIAERKLEIEREKGDALRKAESDAAAQTLSVNRECDAAVAAINSDIDAKILELEKERAARKAEVEAARTKRKQEATVALQSKREKIAQITADELTALDAEARPQLDSAIEQVTAAKDAIAAHARAATLREEIEVQTAAHRAAAWKYDRLSEVLQRLEALRLEKLQHLPVAGLVVEDGVPYLDGIEWQNVNLARRVEAILQICCMQTGELPLILWDDSEHADGEMRAAIEQGLADAGYQVISAQVTDGPLNIEVREEVAA